MVIDKDPVKATKTKEYNEYGNNNGLEISDSDGQKTDMHIEMIKNYRKLVRLKKPE